jgi:O-acetylhomoserine/O-acetylserine sulfhydrylase-like pyridoxal-dependent enzyme
MDKGDIITLSITGLYTIVYVIVFIIQKAQFSKMKEINQSMKSFMDIFDIDEVKKYVELKTENANMKAANFITDSEAVQNVMNEGLEDATQKAKELISKQLVEENVELLTFVTSVLKEMDEDNRNGMIESVFPKNGRHFTKYFNRDQ